MNRVDRTPGVRLVTDRPEDFTAPPAPPPVDLTEAEDKFREYPVVALRGRINSGFAVQLLWSPLDGETYITCVLNGACDTFAVPPEHANEAFEHPFAWGCSLPL